MFRTGKAIEMEIRLVIDKRMEEKRWGVTANRYEALSMKIFLNSIVIMVTQSCEYAKNH